jgi:signal transduction histidine kinase
MRARAKYLFCAFWVLATSGVVEASECYGAMGRADGPWEVAVTREPREAITRLRELLASGDRTGGSSRPGTAGIQGSLSTAHLHALLADAHFALGENEIVIRTLDAGIAALRPDDEPALRDRLVLQRIAMHEVIGDFPRAHREFEAAAAQVPETVPYYPCVLINRGYLRYRAGKFADAVADLTRAYRLTADPEREATQIAAGHQLGMIYAVLGFHDDAERLNDEAVRFHERSGDSRGRAEALFRRGDARLIRRDFVAAEADLRRSATMFAELRADFDLFFSVERLCRLLVATRRLDEAQTECTNARTRAERQAMPDMVKSVSAHLGEIAFLRGQSRAALPLLDRALAVDDAVLSSRMLGEIHGVRARVREQLGDASGALQDVKASLEQIREDSQRWRDEQLAVLNVRFEADRKDQDLQRARAEAAGEVRLRNLALVSAVLLVFAVVLATLEWRRRHRAELERRAAEDSLSGLARLAGGVAHEFNNVMTIVRQANGLIARRPSVRQDPTAASLSGEIEAAGAAGARITAQMLSFARQQNLSVETIELNAFLQANRAVLQRLVGDAVTLDVQVDSPAPKLDCDPRQLMLALANLVTNARDAMPSGGKLWIRVHRASDAGTVRIDVTDTGVGMSTAVLERAREPFYSTKDTGQGSGLGLSMVDGFARQSGGLIEIISGLGVGTTVTLLLPRSRAPTSDSATHAASGKPAADRATPADPGSVRAGA